ncbi:hypothetical protein QYE76_052743, partial [Lolium multiflorum]
MEYSRLCRCGGDGHLEALTGDNIDLIAAHLDVTDTVRLAACSRELYDQISNDEGKMHHWDEPCLLMPPPAYWFDDPWFVATASRLHVTVYDLVPLDHPRRSVTLPFMHDRKWLGANGDWIAAADHRGCQWCLVNVYTERHIPLPSPPDPKIGHGVTYQPATKDWLYYLCWSRAINLLKIVICQVPTKGGRYADYKLIALFDKRIFYLEGGGDWRMLKNPTPEQIVPAFCDAIELGGQVFAVDEIRGWTYCWDTPNENPMSMFVIPPPVVDDQQYAWFLAPTADGKRLMIILTVNNIGIANAEVPHDIPYAANGLQLRQYPPVATYVFEQDPISLFIAARAGDFHWRQVNSLGDHSLFLGLNYPIIANLKKRESKAPDGTLVPFMRKNCVYTAYRKYLHNQYPKILRCNLQPDEGATYQRTMQRCLKDQIGRNVHAYVDDIAVMTRKGSDLISDLKETFDNLRRYKMMLNPLKCVFGVPAGKLLGFIVSHRGIEVNPEKIKAILNIKMPTCLKDVQRLTGCVAAISRFVSRLGEKALPLYKLLKKTDKFVWDEAADEALQGLKNILSSPPILAAPAESEPMLLYMAATNKEHPMTVVSKAPLATIINNSDATGRVAKWGIELSAFDINYEARTAIKSQVLADFIADWIETLEGTPVPEPEAWVMHFDGSKQHQGSGAGVTLKSPTGEELQYVLQIHFEANNMAEYEALLHGLRIAKEIGIKHIICCGDSDLVAQQVAGTWNARNSVMAAYRDEVDEIAKCFLGYEVKYVRRDDNTAADMLSKLGSGRKPIPPGIFLEHLRIPSVKGANPENPDLAVSPAKEVMAIIPAWTQPFLDYLIDRKLPEDEVLARQIIRRARSYTIVDGQLYKRSANGVFLKCVSNQDGIEILREIHAGDCGHHAAPRSLVAKAFRLGFYWLTAKEDAEKLVKTCRGCQYYATQPNAPAQELKTIPITWPFAVWGLDMVGKLKKSSPGGHEYLLVAIDKFSKWIEAKPVRKADGATALKFVCSLVTRFGIPHSIITDNGTNFAQGELKDYCDEVGIRLDLASVAHPQSNGQVERANGLILAGIKPRLEEPLRRAVLPTDIIHDSPRVSAYDEETADEARQLSVDLIEEARNLADQRSTIYQQKLRRYHSRRVRNRSFMVGDLVLRLRQVKDHKLQSPWEGLI